MVAPLVSASIGVVLALIFVRAVASRTDALRLRLPAMGLAVAAGIYVVFALVALSGEWILVEIGLAITFSLTAFVTVRAALLLGLAWMLHVGWDAIHLHYLEGAIAPEWYPPLCMAFDVLVGVWLIREAFSEQRSGAPERFPADLTAPNGAH
jgi:hypothetical protein